MGRQYEELSGQVADFIAAQPMFFVATAPLSSDGRVNLSPKGMDSLRIIDEHTVAYADLTGSGAETIGHLRENGRITIMWCSFGEKARIVRVQGRGDYLLPGDDGFDELAAQFPSFHSLRSIVRIKAERIADSCGYGVPEMKLVAERSQLTEWAARKTSAELVDYMRSKNTTTIDGLPAWQDTSGRE